VRPTFPDSATEGPVAELHLFDFEADLYGARIEVFFGRFLRDELTFATSAELTAQIDADVILARRVLTDESLTKKTKDCLYTAATRVL
jgi:riboflavin kinase/FMN adenylyltransferase